MYLPDPININVRKSYQNHLKIIFEINSGTHTQFIIRKKIKFRSKLRLISLVWLSSMLVYFQILTSAKPQCDPNTSEIILNVTFNLV